MTKRAESVDGNVEPDGGLVEVLVVDDSHVVRTLVAGYLDAAGCSVDQAQDGATALRKMAERSFDVIVTDLQMPVLDGFELIERARELGHRAEFVILTGAQSQDINAAVRALRLGASDFLTKPPASPHAVALTVSRAAEKKRLIDHKRRLVERLERLSTTDALTSVSNRRAFDESLRVEVARARRNEGTLSMALFDLDHFKRVNDSYGHLTGDEVLQQLAALLCRSVREGDSVFRYGGEEFSVLMPHTQLEEALLGASRVVGIVARHTVDTRAGRLRVTCSAGVASIRGPAADPLQLVAHADSALYQAKREGRDRARSYARERGRRGAIGPGVRLGAAQPEP